MLWDAGRICGRRNQRRRRGRWFEPATRGSRKLEVEAGKAYVSAGVVQKPANGGAGPGVIFATIAGSSNTDWETDAAW